MNDIENAFRAGWNKGHETQGYETDWIDEDWVTYCDAREIEIPPAESTAERGQVVNDFRADTLDAVMYSVRKWLPDDYVEANPETAAADAREIALKAIEKQEARAEAAEAEQGEERLLRGLLAIVHRDGGQYTHDVGLARSVEDAVHIIGMDRLAARAPAPREAGEVEKSIRWLEKYGPRNCDPVITAYRALQNQLAARPQPSAPQAEAAEAEVEALREALDKIAKRNRAPHSYMTAYAEVVEEAQAALLAREVPKDGSGKEEQQ